MGSAPLPLAGVPPWAVAFMGIVASLLVVCRVAVVIRWHLVAQARFRSAPNGEPFELDVGLTHVHLRTGGRPVEDETNPADGPGPPRI